MFHISNSISFKEEKLTSVNVNKVNKHTRLSVDYILFNNLLMSSLASQVSWKSSPCPYLILWAYWGWGLICI
jgi:hypothetical protein